jgi:hypothetical protein
MEIAPVAAVRLMPLAPRTLVSGEMAPVFDIDNLERIGSESYRAKNEESRGGMQNEYEELLEEDDEEFSGPFYVPAARRQVARRLSIFA